MKPMMRSVLLTVLLLSGCTGLKVDLDYDPARDFAAYHTYAWLPQPSGSDADIRNDLVNARIVSAVDDSLAQKNMKQADKSAADFLVTYHINIENRVDVQTVETGFHYRPSWHWGGGFDTETVVRQYKAGTLVLDIIDRKSDKLTWRGAVETRLREGLTPEQRDQEVRDIVKALLAQFPPQKQTAPQK